MKDSIGWLHFFSGTMMLVNAKKTVHVEKLRAVVMGVIILQTRAAGSNVYPVNYGFVAPSGRTLK
jgi:hypothetical protein